MNSIWDIVRDAEIKPHKDNLYYHVYDELLGSMRQLPLNIVEVGVYQGGSILMFAQYFPNARILGIDVNDPPENFYRVMEQTGDIRERVGIRLGSQHDPAFLTRSIDEFFGDPSVDIIIDDASHIYDLSKVTFDHLFFNHLKSRGLYFLEDWEVGYWPKWYDGNPDGLHGLPRLVKELVDLTALQARTGLWEDVRAMPVDEQQVSPIYRMLINAGIVTVVKF